MTDDINSATTGRIVQTLIIDPGTGGYYSAIPRAAYSRENIPASSDMPKMVKNQKKRHDGLPLS